jgi:hypothetical protein
MLCVDLLVQKELSGLIDAFRIVQSIETTCALTSDQDQQRLTTITTVNTL